MLFCGIGETTINSLLDGGIKFAICVELNPSADSTKEISNATRPLTPRLVDKGGFSFIYFDLETTGLSNELCITTDKYKYRIWNQNFS